MRKIGVKLSVVLAITAIAAFGADESLGTWKLNIAKSKVSPTAPVKSLTTTREAAENGVKQTTTGERADGTKVNYSYTAKYDGSAYPVTGAPWDTISITQVDPNVLKTETKKTAGKYKSTSQTIVSRDGMVMTTPSKGIDAEGKPFNYTMVWEEQAGDQSVVDSTISTHSSQIAPAKPKPGKK